MMQQINLYQPMFRKQKVVFSSATMLQVGLFFIVLFTGLYLYQQGNLAPYQEQISGIEKSLIELRKQVQIMGEKQSNQGKSKLLENEIAKLTGELEKRERIARVLVTREFGNSSGFSSYLEAFSRGHVEGTWLTEVSISQGGTALGLKGKTLSSELVPVYIQKLAEEKSLKGSAFNVMELARVESEDTDSELNFMVSTN